MRVDDVEWTERPTLFGAGPTERAYTLSTDEQGRTLVVFGDGVRGARLPSGVNNVRASYRQGLGRDGNVGADKLTQLMTRPLGLEERQQSARRPQGGTDPEPADAGAAHACRCGTRTLGRAVSLLDYEDFALRLHRHRQGAGARCCSCAAGRRSRSPSPGQDGAALPPATRCGTTCCSR